MKKCLPLPYRNWWKAEPFHDVFSAPLRYLSAHELDDTFGTRFEGTVLRMLAGGGWMPEPFHERACGTSPKPLQEHTAGMVPEGRKSTLGEYARHLSGIVSRDDPGNRSGSGLIPYRHHSETQPVPCLAMSSGIVSNPLHKTVPVAVVSVTLLPHLSMTTFLTVKEAAKLVGKSPSSIRRILYPILEDNRHPDRHHIEPDVATAKSLRVKGENFAWKISEELLRREMPEGESKPSSDSKSNSQNGDDHSDAIIEILRGQLTIKDQQIAAANDVIKGLSERVREGNILMGSLQQQLAPPDLMNRKKNDVVDTNAPSAKPEKGSEALDVPTKKTHWLFKKIF